MKWWNREQINNFICFNILRMTQEADQEKERWIWERCSFFSCSPRVLQDFAPLHIAWQNSVWKE